MKCYYDQQIFMLQSRGGISRYFYELITRFAAMGEAKPALFAGAYITRLPLLSMRGCRVIGVPRHFKIGGLHDKLQRICEAVNRWLLRRMKPAIYHATYFQPAERPANTKLVITIYDMIHERFPEQYAGDPTAERKRAACESADAIICISESARTDLVAHYPAFAPKTSVVYLAADAGLRVMADQAPNNARKPYALFVGSRKGYKGFDVALDAWRMLASVQPELQLLCAGGGAFAGEETAEIERRGLTGRVVQRSASDRELAGLYRGATVYICPSRYEGFGLPVLEAMTCGCPVVCSRSSSLPEVGGEAAVYFAAGDAAGLAARVLDVVGNANHRAERIAAGYEQAKRFSWNECARQTLEVYRRCLATPATTFRD